MSTQSKVGVLPEGTLFQSAKDAAAGYSAILCDCGKPFTLEQVAVIMETGTEDVCGSCGVSISQVGLRYRALMVEVGSAVLVNDDVVRSTKWYHATNSESWMNDLLNDPEGFNDGLIPFVHVGTMKAAMERAADINRKYLYTVELADGVSLSPKVVEDENDWPEWVGDGMVGADAQRYLNRWESAGSISLLVDPRKLNVIKRDEIVRGEIKRSQPVKAKSQHALAVKAYYAQNKQAA